MVTRTSTAAAALRELQRCFTTYVLYAGDTTQPSYQAALVRMQESCDEALADGPVDVVVGPTALSLGESSDRVDGTGRLAHAAFERRVEHLSMCATPSAADVAVLLDALVRPVPNVESAGGVPAILSAADVTSITTRLGVPDPTTGQDDLIIGVSANSGPAVVEQERLDLEYRPGEEVAGYYDRLQAVHDALTPEQRAAARFFTMLSRAVRSMPPAVRVEFGALVLDRAATDPFADTCSGQVTDIDLADTVCEVAAARGIDALDLATRTIARHPRHATVRALVAARARGERTAPDAANAQSLRHSFPAHPEEGRRLALGAFVDYVACQPDPAQLQTVADAVEETVRDGVRKGDVENVAAVLEAVDRAASIASPVLRDTLVGIRTSALTASVVAEVVSGQPRHDAEALLALFGSSGSSAMAGAFAILADADDRSALGDMLARLTNPSAFARVLATTDPRVALGLVITGTRMNASGRVAILERLAKRQDAAVCSAAVRALGAMDEGSAVVALGQLVRTHPDRGVRLTAARAIADSPASGATEELTAMLSGRGRQRLPWKDRRLVKAMLRGRKAGG